MCRQNHNAGNKTPTAAGPDGTQNASRDSAPSPSAPYRCPRTLNMLSPPFLTGPPLSSYPDAAGPLPTNIPRCTGPARHRCQLTAMLLATACSCLACNPRVCAPSSLQPHWSRLHCALLLYGHWSPLRPLRHPDAYPMELTLPRKNA